MESGREMRQYRETFMLPLRPLILALCDCHVLLYIRLLPYDQHITQSYRSTYIIPLFLADTYLLISVVAIVT
jgi:hypothetical protein